MSLPIGSIGPQKIAAFELENKFGLAAEKLLAALGQRADMVQEVDVQSHEERIVLRCEAVDAMQLAAALQQAGARRVPTGQRVIYMFDGVEVNIAPYGAAFVA